MAETTSTPGGAPQSHNMSATGAEVLTLPQGLSLSEAEFKIDGDDLVLTFPDGSKVTVEDYYSQPNPPQLASTDGANLSGDMVVQLTGTPEPTNADAIQQFAQQATGQVIGGTDGAPIGTVKTLTGEVWVTRADGTRIQLKQGDQVFQGDNIETGPKGAIGVLLADETTFSMGSESQMVLDEMIYDPATQNGSLNVSVVQGVFTFVSGQVAKTDPDAMKIDTPVATIGIRGTQVGIEIPPEGEMQVILMQEADGFVGEVVIENNTGQVVMNQGGDFIKIGSYDTQYSDRGQMRDEDIVERHAVTLRHLPVEDTSGERTSGNHFGLQEEIETGAGQKNDQTQNEQQPSAEQLANMETAAGGQDKNSGSGQAQQGPAQPTAEQLNNLQTDAGGQGFGEDFTQVTTTIDPYAGNTQNTGLGTINVGAPPSTQQQQTQAPVDNTAQEAERAAIQQAIKDAESAVARAQTSYDNARAAANEAQTFAQQEPAAQPAANAATAAADSAQAALDAAKAALEAAKTATTAADAQAAANNANSAANTAQQQETAANTANDQAEAIVVEAGQAQGAEVADVSTSGDEDTAIGLNLNITKLDSDETAEITLSGIPAGATLANADGPIEVNPDGTVTLTEAQLAGLTITPPANSDADFNIGVSVITIDGENVSTPATATITVGVDGVADVPTLEVGSPTVSGIEDGGAIALNISSALTDTDGSETLSVTISGVPAGAALSAGTDNGDGTWTLSPADLEGLTITPAADSGADFQLTVTSTSTEAGGGTATNTATIDVSVAAQADAPTVTASSLGGLEDGGPIALNIDATAAAQDVEGEVVSLTISGVPEGAVLTAGTKNDDGTWTLSPEDLDGLAVTLPPNFDENFSLSVTATAEETDPDTGAVTQATSAPVSFTVEVGAVADAPTVTADAAIGNEDSAIALSIDAEAASQDINGEIVSFTISGVPDGAVLSAGTKNDDGTWTLSPADLDGLTVTPAANSDGDFTLQVTATAQETDPETGAVTTATSAPVDLAVTVNAVADAPTLDVSAASGDEDTAIALNISSALTDTDGSETLSITISGVPSGAVLSAGTKNEDGTWTLAPEDLQGLTVTPGANDSTNFQLTVTATSTDGTDTNSVSQTLDVTVAGVADAPELTVTAATGTEDSAIALNIDAALTDDTEVLGISISGIPEGAVLKSGDQEISITNGVANLTAAQLANLTITPPLNSDADFNLTVTATSTETDPETGEQATATTTGTIAVSVAPDADAPTLVLDNAAGGEDSAIPLSIDAGLTDASENLSITISGLPDGAVLSAGTKNEDGTWTLSAEDLDGLTVTPPANSNEDLSLTVTATSTESDGSTASTTSTMNVAVTGVADAPTLSIDLGAGTLTGGITDPTGTVTVLNTGGVTAGYNNTYGYYVMGDDGTPQMGEIIWPNVKTSVGQTFTLDGVDPEKIGFFIIPDGASKNPGMTPGMDVTFQQDSSGNWHAVGPNGQVLSGAGDPVLFSDPALNENNFDYTQDAAGPGNQNWEDLAGGGDQNFNDVNMNVVTTPSLPVGGDNFVEYPLNINAALTDTDGSETLSATISGLPAGATVTMADGTTYEITDTDTQVPVTADQLQGITLKIPAGADFDLQVTATSTENDGDTASTSTTLPVDVIDAIADDPTLEVSAAQGDEDTAIALNISSALTDLDGSETLSITISGVPSGAVLSAGTDNGDGTWTLSPEDLDGLTVTPPANSSEPFDLTVTATSTEVGGDTASVSKTLTVTVDSVADGATVTTGTASGDEDTAIDLPISITKGDESETAEITLSGIPSGAVLSNANGPIAVNEDGTVTLTEADLAGLQITPPANSDTDIPLGISVVTVDGDSRSAPTTGTITVGVDGVADVPTLEVGSAVEGSGLRGDGIPLDISAALTDTDGSETLSVTISGVPDGATLSAGTKNEDGTWTLSAADLDGLTVTPADDSGDDFQLTVTATSREADGGEASQTATIDVDVNRVVGSAEGDEINLTEEGDTVAYAGEGDDIVTGTDGDDIIFGEAGNDVLIGGAGNDVLDGGEGIDTADFSALDPNSPLYVDLGEGTASSADGEDTLVSIENVIGGAGDDVIIGSDGENTLVGGLGDDVITGGAGDDVIVGGEGTDTAVFEGDFEEFTIDLDSATGELSVAGGLADGTDTLTGVEILRFGDMEISVSDLLTAAVPDVGPSQGVSVTEDVSVALPLSASLDESVLAGTESLSVTLSGIPEGAVLTAGGQALDVTYDENGVGSVTFPGGVVPADLAITPPADSAEDFTLTLTATSTAAATTDGAADTATSVQTLTVTVSPDAEAPTITQTGDNVFAEDAQIPLGDVFGAVPAEAGEEVVSFTIGGLPEGATLSAGTQNDDGSWTVDAADMAGLTMTLPKDYDADFSLSVSATSAQVDPDNPDLIDYATSDPVAVPIVINAEADAPTLTVSDAAGTEDQPIPLSIDAALTDSSEVLSVTISGVPDGAVLSAGTQNDDGTWTLSAADLDGLTVTPPANSDEDFTLTVAVTSTETDPDTGATTQATTTGSMFVSVAPDADAPTLEVANATGDEDTAIPLDITAGLTDTDGSEVLGVSISGIPAGAVLMSGDQVISVVDGVATLTPDQLSNLTITPPANSDADFPLTVTATTTDGTSTAEVSKTLDVTVNAVADAPTLDVAAASGDEDTAIALNISSALTDTDGSETLSITISGVPDGATLSAGTKNEDGTWTLAPEDLQGLTVTPGANDSTNFQLTVTATSTDGTDTNSVSQTLDVTVAGVADAPELTVTAATGTEDSAIPLSIDAALTDDTEVLGISISGIPEGAVLKSGDQEISITNGVANLTAAQLANLTITPPANSDADFNLTVTATSTETDPETGEQATATTTGTIAVSVAPDADAPTLVLDNAAGSEDTDIPLSIDAGLTDDSELLSVTISGLPQGATLSAGTYDEASDTWTLSADQLDGLTVKPAPNSNEDMTLTVTATSTESDGSTASTTSTLNVAVTGVADAPTLTVDLGEGTLTGGTEEVLGSVTVQNMGGVTAGYNNTYGYYVMGDDGTPQMGEIIWPNVKTSVGQSFTLDGVDPEKIGFFIIPDGASKNPGMTPGMDVTFQQDSSGNWHAVGPNGQRLSGAGDPVLFSDPALNENNFDYTQDVAGPGNQNWEDLAGGGDQNFNDVNVNVTTTPVQPGSGPEMVEYPLNINAALTDTDGSETLSATISGLPAGAVVTMADGTTYEVTDANTQVPVTAGQLQGITVAVPVGSEDFSLQVTATSTENDGDTASVSTSVPVDVLDPVADAPTLEVSDAQGDEDTAIPLNVAAALTDLDGSETLSITISGVPSGALLSAGTDNGDGTWTLTPDQLDGLTITPPANSSDDFQLTVSATSTESNGGDQATVTATLDVTVAGVADDPTLSVSDTGGMAGTTVPLDITAGLQDLDGSETLSVTISGIPQGVTLSAGTVNPDGSVTLTGAQLEGLTMTLPSSIPGQGGGGEPQTLYSQNFNHVQEGATSASGPNGFTSTGGQWGDDDRTGVDNNRFEFENPRGGDISTWTSAEIDISGQENVTFSFDLKASGDMETSGSAADYFKVIAVVDGVEHELMVQKGGFNGNRTFTLDDIPQGDSLVIKMEVRTTADDEVYRMDNLKVEGTPAAAEPLENFQLHVEATATEADGDTATVSTNLNVAVGYDVDASAPTLTVTPASGNEDTAIALNISSALTDTDGSESLSITISGVPEGATLSAGTQNQDGTWTLSPADLQGLTITPADNDSSNFDLTITATSTEANGGDTTSVSETLTVTVAGVADAPTLDVSNASGTEDTAIPLDIQAGLTDDSEILSVSISGIPNGAVLMSGDQVIQVSNGVANLTPEQLSGLTITPPANSDADFNLTVTATSTETDPETGAQGTATTTGTIAVSVDPEADAPVLVVQDAVGNEDTGILLDISAAKTDSSEQLSVSISGIPDGATLTITNPAGHPVNLPIHNGTANVPVGLLNGDLILTPPADSADDFQLTVTATSKDGDSVATTTATMDVTVNGVADGAVVTSTASQGIEDTAIPITVNVAEIDVDGSETLTVTLSNIPEGAVIFRNGEVVTPNEDGTVTLGEGELDGLSVLPPANFSGTFDIAVSAQTNDEGDLSDVATGSITVDVSGAADGATLNLTAAAGDEDTAIALPISIDKADASETAEITLSGIPSGAVLSNANGPIPVVDGIAVLTEADLDGLQITPPANSDADFNLGVSVVTTDGISVSAPTTGSISVGVDGVADMPTLEVTSAAAGVEDGGPIALDIASALTDTDGSETLSVTISGVPEGATLSAGTLNQDGTWTLSPADLQGLTVTPAANSGEDFQLTVTATSTEADGGTATNTATIDVSVASQADAPRVTASSEGGLEDGGPIPLDIDANAAAQDVEGEVISLTISGVPEGAVLNHGVNNGDGTWSVTPEELDGLAITLPENFDENFSLSVTATAEETDPDTGETTYATSAPVTFEVEVGAVADAPTVTVGAASGAEDTAIPLSIDADAAAEDLAGEVVSLTISGVPAGAALSAGTQNTDGTWTLTPAQLDGLSVTPPAGSGADFTLQVTATAQETDPETGEVTTATSAPVDLAVSVAAVADTPSLNVGPVTGAEDTAIPLNITAGLNDQDGSEVLSVTITGVPAGAVLSAGTYDAASNTWTLSGDQLDGLTVTPPENSDADFQLGVIVTATDTDPDTGAVTTATSRGTIEVTVDGVADGATLTLDATRGDEDTAIALPISIDKADGDETAEITLSGIPQGAQLSNANGPIPVVDGIAVLTEADLAGLQIQPPANSGADFQIGVSVTTTDGTSVSAPATGTINVGVDAVVDVPTLSVASASGAEDTAIPLNITAGLNDQDGSEVLSVTISDVPPGAVLTLADGSTFTATEENSTFLFAGDQLSGLTITPPANSDDDFVLTVTATTIETDPDTGVETVASVDGTLAVSVDPAADAPTLVLDNATGNEDSWIPLSIDAGLTDDSELLSVTISGVPAGASLSAGTYDSASNTWTVSPEDLDGLSVKPAPNSNADFSLTVTATSTESDGSTASTTSTLNVDVKGVADAPTLSVNLGEGTLIETPGTGGYVGNGSNLNNTYVDSTSNNHAAGGGDDVWVVNRDLRMNEKFEMGGGNDKLVINGDVPGGVNLNLGGGNDSLTINGNITGNVSINGAGQSNGGGDVLYLGKGSDHYQFQNYTNNNGMINTQLVDLDTGKMMTINNIEAIAFGDGTFRGNGNLVQFETPTPGQSVVEYPLDITSSLTDTDGSETLSVTVSGLPDGAVLSAGTANSDGSWTLTPNQLSGLTLTVPSTADSFSLSVTATSTENDGDSFSVTKNVGVSVDDFAETPELAAADAQGNEDTAIALDIDAALTDLDGSETLAVSISGIPAGAVLKSGDTVIQVTNGVANLTPAQLEGLTITPPANSGADFQLTVSATSTETSTGDTNTVSTTMDVTVNAVADAPGLTVTNAAGAEDTAIPLNIGTNLNDGDGSEVLSVSITGIPAGAVLANQNGPINVVNGAVTLSAAQLEGLTIQPPANSDADFNLNVTATATETDPDTGAVTTATTTGSIAVSVDPAADAPTLVVGNAAGSEDAFIPLSIDADLTDGGEQLSITITGLPQGAVLSAGSYDEASDSWTLSAGDLNGLSVKPAPNSNEDMTLTVTATSTESDGSTASTSSTLNVAVTGVADAPTLAVNLGEGTLTGGVEEVLGSVTVQNMGQADAGYNNTYGYYVIGQDGTPQMGEIIWPNVKSSVGQSFTLDGVDPESIGFFLIPDGASNNSGLQPGMDVTFQQGTNGNWHVVGPNGQRLTGTGDPVLFSDPALNEGSFDYTRDTSRPGNQNWEDLVGGGDNDFNDVNINVTTTPNQPGTGPSMVEYPLDITSQLTDTDGSETLSATLGGLPVGAVVTLANGTEITVQSPTQGVAIPADQLQGISLKVPADAANFSLSVTATATENDGDAASVSTSVAVVVDGVADAPELTVSNAAGNEDTDIPLDITAALTDLDGSESLSITISGVPAGATLSAGTYDAASNTWTLSGDDLDGLTVRPAPNSSDDFQLTVSATSTEASTGDTETVTANIDVSVAGVADAPTLSAADATGEVGEPIPLDITAGLQDLDGSESLSVTISGIPEGATLSAGTVNADGSVTLTGAQLEGLSISLPQGGTTLGAPQTLYSQNFSNMSDGTISAGGANGFTSTGGSQGNDNRTAVDEGRFEFQNPTSGNVSTWSSAAIDISGKDDVTFKFDLKSSGDMESSGSSGDYFKVIAIVDGVPHELMVKNGGLSGTNTFTLDNIPQGDSLVIKMEVKTTASDEIYKMDNLQVEAKPVIGHEPVENFQLHVEATATEADGDTATVSTDLNVTVNVDDEASAPTLTVSDASGLEDTAIPLDITASLTDLDGSEEITAITISGVPAGAVLNNGTYNAANNTWTLEPADLVDLTVTPAANSSADFQITVSVTSTEANGGATATTSATIDVDVAGVADGVNLSMQNAQGLEDTTIPLNIGASLKDLDGSETITSVTISGVPAGAVLNHGTLNSDGTWSLSAADLNGLTVKPAPNSSDDFQLTVSATTTDEGGSTAVSTGSLSVSVTGVADDPTLSVADATGEAGTTVPLDISAGLQDLDGSESLSVTISGIPQGATLSAGTVNPDGSVTLTGAQLEGLSITLPETQAGAGGGQPQTLYSQNFNDTFDGQTAAWGANGFSSTGGSWGDDDRTAADNDRFEFENPSGGDISTFSTAAIDISGQENVTFTFDMKGYGDLDSGGHYGDYVKVIAVVDGVEHTLMTHNGDIDNWTTFTLDNIPEGNSLVIKMEVKTTADDEVYKMDNLSIVGTPAAAEPLESFQLHVEATATEADGDTATVSTDLNVTVNNDSEASAPTLTVSNASGTEDTAMALNIAAALTDTDGSETLAVSISGIPAGAVLKSGDQVIQVTDGVAELSPNQLSGLSITPPANSDADFQLTVTATSTEENGGATTTTTAAINVAVAADADTPVITSASVGAPVVIDGAGGDEVTINSANVTSGDNGFTVVARTVNANGSLSNASSSNISFNSNPVGFGVSGGNASGDAKELGFNSASGKSEELIVAFDDDVSSADVSFAWMHSGEHAKYELYKDGVKVGEGIVTGVTDGIDAPVTLAAANGGSFDAIVFTAPGNDDDFLINSITYETAGSDPIAEYPINVSASLADLDGSESLAVTIGGIPEGATLNHGVNNGDGTWTVAGGDLGGLKLSVPLDGDLPAFNLTFAATATEANGGDTATSSAVTVQAAGVDLPEPVGEVLVDATIGEAEPIVDGGQLLGVAYDLNISASAGGNANASDLTITVSGIPAGATLTAGTDNGNGSFTLTPAQLSGLQVVASSAVTGDFALSVVAHSGGADSIIDKVTAELDPSLFLEYGEENWDNDSAVAGDTSADTWTGDYRSEVNYGSTKNDDLNTGGGGDTLYGGAGNDKLTGQWGADTFYGGSGNDTLSGGDQDDRLYGGSGNDKLDGGTGNDLLYGGSGNDSIFGDHNEDVIFGGSGNDSINAGTGNDTVYGGSGNDTIVGDHGDDRIYGGTGNDKIDAGTGNDYVHGGAGDDSIFGDHGNDTLYGGSGDDTIDGGSGNDILFGGLGDDFLQGGDGNDVLFGGAGDDILRGGSGNDTFIFDADSGHDIIEDIMNQDTMEFHGQQFDMNDMIFREDEHGDVQIAFQGKEDMSVTLKGVKYDDLDRNGDGNISESYSVTQTDDGFKVQIDEH